MENLTMSEEQKQRLGDKYISEGTAVTDNDTQTKYRICKIEDDGIVLAQASSFSNHPKNQIKVGFDEFLKKYDEKQISVAGYSHEVPDQIILHQVVRDIVATGNIGSLTNTIGELSTEEVGFKSGGVVGTIKMAKNGYVKDITNQFGKKILMIQAGDMIYKWHPSDKTYKSIDTASRLGKANLGVIKVMKQGGITNQYTGKTPEQIWKDWTAEQRIYFLNDHDEKINKRWKDEGNANTSLNSDKWYASIYSELPTAIKEELAIHIGEGQYKQGARVKKKDDELEENAKRVIQNEIYAVQSSLVEKLLKDEIIPYDDIQNLYEYPEKIETHSDFRGGSEEQKQEEIDRLKQILVDEPNISEASVSEIESEIEGLENLESEPQEIYEWWLVSDWLKEKLLEQNEPILDSEYGTWWGRTSSGQQIIADGIIQKILKKIGNYKDGGKTGDEKGYHGWKNYETWNVKLWLDNDEGSQSYWDERATEIAKTSKKSQYLTKKEEARRTLGDELKEYHEENNPLADQASTYSDLLSGALSEVDWYEIAENLLTEKMKWGGQMKKGGEAGKKIILTGLSKDIQEDSFEEGQDPDTRQHIFYEKNLGSFDTADELIAFLHKNNYLSEDKKNYTAFEDGRITYSQLEDEEGSAVDEKDAIYKEWKKGKAKLWTADYDIYIEVGEIKTPTIEEIAKMFGIQTYKTGGKTPKADTSRTFNYLKLVPHKNGLEIFLTPDGEEKVKELKGEEYFDEAIMTELFEDVQGNSEYIYHQNLGDIGFGMTGADGITDGYHMGGDHFDYITEHPESAKVYWYPNYQIHSSLEILLEDGVVFFSEAPKMKQGGRADITKNYYRFRQHSPKGVTECAVPEWAQKAAGATKKGAKITTCKKDGKWFIQSIMIPKDGVNATQAKRIAEDIKSKFSRKKKALGGVAESCTCDDISKTIEGLEALRDTTEDASEKKRYQELINDLS